MTMTIYEALGGKAGIRNLVEAFYPKVVADPLLGPLFPEDIEPVMDKQELFLTQFFGGEPLYTEQYGHPRMRARHMHIPITNDHAAAWLRCMEQALAENVPDVELRQFVLERLSGSAYFFVNS
ncbi:globin [Paenibacillus sp. NEAU-GSW1]|uniref:globin domain-containing protein n=1 Tax=Paenibacillus sp. NEAU-GSW1 TaxID=2682486 RepID=UPI0020A6D85D|nr:globin [Paenibacillus sp. NEAU-GSW1]